MTSKRFFHIIRYDWPFHLITLLTAFLPDNIVFIRLRGFLLSFFVKKSGTNLQIGRDVTIYNPSMISFGDNVYIAKGCFFTCGEEVVFENNILVGPYVVIVTSNHALENGSYYFGQPVDSGKILIQSGSWLGAHVTILPQSTVSECTLIAANAVFKGTSTPYGVYAGLPAKLVKVNPVKE